jgi:hypothetical protein
MITGIIIIYLLHMRQHGTCDGKLSDRQASSALALTMMERTFNNLKSIPRRSWCLKVSLSLLSWLFVFLAELHLYACQLACKIQGLTHLNKNVLEEMTYMNIEGSFR